MARPGGGEALEDGGVLVGGGAGAAETEVEERTEGAFVVGSGGEGEVAGVAGDVYRLVRRRVRQDME